MHRSVMVLMIPQPLATETLSWMAKSVGRIEAVLRMTCRVLSLGLTREMYLQPDNRAVSSGTVPWSTRSRGVLYNAIIWTTRTLFS